MSDCTHNCSTCDSKCSTIEYLSLHEGSHIKNIIGVVSGKGGVGKSLVTSLLASKMKKEGYRVGILDADITGPSIPKAFGYNERAEGDGDGILPGITKEGIEIISLNMFVDNPKNPVVYRGPALVGVLSQFYKDVKWGDLDYLFIDMPPGTADINLTIFQQIPLSGLIIVTTPQDLVNLIVAKSMKMAEMLNVPVYGLVENMSYLKCPDCGKKIYLFGESHIDEVVADYHVPLLAQIPIDPKLTEMVDNGKVYEYDNNYFDYLFDIL